MQAYETQFTIKGIEDVYMALTAPKRIATMEVFKILLPSETKDSWELRHRLLERTSLPAGIRSTCYYSWKLCEVRHGLVGRDGVSLTGIIARSHGLPGLPIDSALTRERTEAMQLQPCGAKDSADEEEEEDQAAEEEEILTEADMDASGNQILHDSTKIFLRWKCSYRRTKPERNSKRKCQAKLLARAKNMQRVIPQLAPASRHMQYNYSQKAADDRKSRQSLDSKEDTAFRNAAEAVDGVAVGTDGDDASSDSNSSSSSSSSSSSTTHSGIVVPMAAGDPTDAQSLDAVAGYVAKGMESGKL